MHHWRPRPRPRGNHISGSQGRARHDDKVTLREKRHRLSFRNPGAVYPFWPFWLFFLDPAIALRPRDAGCVLVRQPDSRRCSQQRTNKLQERDGLASSLDSARRLATEKKLVVLVSGGERARYSHGDVGCPRVLDWNECSARASLGRDTASSWQSSSCGTHHHA